MFLPFALCSFFFALYSSPSPSPLLLAPLVEKGQQTAPIAHCPHILPGTELS
jgi:hypothetical protein